MVKLLSVVVSVYNEELALREFYQETGAVLKALPSSWDYELLFVNDGSADRSLEILRELARRDSRRHNYYTHYTGKKWGDSHNYHLSLDSGALGYDLCVKLIVEAAKSME